MSTEIQYDPLVVEFVLIQSVKSNRFKVFYFVELLLITYRQNDLPLCSLLFSEGLSIANCSQLKFSVTQIAVQLQSKILRQECFSHDLPNRLALES